MSRLHILSLQLGAMIVLAAGATESGDDSPRRPEDGQSETRSVAFGAGAYDGERVARFTIEPEASVLVNAPAASALKSTKPVLLICYALPNGNTTAQTIGKVLKPGDDWHFDIQHIGAQTRFLRAIVTNRTIVVAYLEAASKSWPAWRRKHGDDGIPRIIDRIKELFPGQPLELVLTGHSGGGSFTFGYLNCVDSIPDDVVRIAFLDSNYAYDTERGHGIKLINWLETSPAHYLCVLAYHDSIALLDGKTFVSEQGGTWGRSHAMLEDFGGRLSFTSRTNDAGLGIHSALDGRVEFLLKENPDRKILHTVQVESNGFIHAMVTGTLLENQGYEYLGERAYTNRISSE